MSKFVGSGKVKINGQLCKTVPDSIELMFGGHERTAESADDTVCTKDGPLVPSMLNCEFLHTKALDIKMLNDLEGATIEIEFNNGITYVMPNASRTGPPIKTSSANGRVPFQAQGDEVPGL